MVRYKKVVVKLSSEAIAGAAGKGVDPERLARLADELLSVHRLGIELGVVVAGGNYFRGRMAEGWGIGRAEADNIGMLGTVMNALMPRGVLTGRGAGDVRVMTAGAHAERGRAVHPAAPLLDADAWPALEVRPGGESLQQGLQRSSAAVLICTRVVHHPRSMPADEAESCDAWSCGDTLSSLRPAASAESLACGGDGTLVGGDQGHRRSHPARVGTG